MGSESAFNGKGACPACEYVGYPEELIRGGCAIEIILWLCFLIPGLIYSIWRRSSPSKVCPKCQSVMIPIQSPRGQKISKQSATGDEADLMRVIDRLREKESEDDKPQSERKAGGWGR